MVTKDDIAALRRQFEEDLRRGIASLCRRGLFDEAEDVIFRLDLKLRKVLARIERVEDMPQTPAE